MLWAGRIISGLVVLFLLFDSIIKVMRLDPAVEGTVEFGYNESVVFGIGLTLLVCTILYAIPRTAILGAILLTGYLGGATATQVRVEDPWFLQTCSQTLGSVGFLVKRCVLYQSAVSGGPQAARTLALSSPKPARP